jgi:hypothetical protein
MAVPALTIATETNPDVAVMLTAALVSEPGLKPVLEQIAHALPRWCDRCRERFGDLVPDPFRSLIAAIPRAAATVSRPAQRPRDRSRRGSAVLWSLTTRMATISKVNYDKAYANLVEQLLAALAAVETEEAAHQFNTQAIQSIRSQAAAVREFYIGEFLSIFKDAAVSRCGVETRECEQALEDAQMEAAVGSVELNARLAAASAAGDREAEHAVWRDREELQTACQAKIDATSRSMDPIMIRLSACKNLLSALGFN